jgi:hypothetical protein
MARVSTADLAARIDGLSDAIASQASTLSRIADNGERLLAALERMAAPAAPRVIEGKATVAAQIKAPTNPALKAPAKALGARRIEGTMVAVDDLAVGDRVRLSATTKTTTTAKVLVVDGDKRRATQTVAPCGSGNLAGVEGVVRGIAGGKCVTVEAHHSLGHVMHIWVRRDQQLERIATA